MSYKKLLATTWLIANSSRGMAALQQSMLMNHHPKTAWVFAHKVREAVAAESKDRTLHNIVEVDGAYFFGHVRQGNKWEMRVDRRLARNQSGKRRVIVAARERGGKIALTVVRAEHEGVPFIREVVSADAHIHADEAHHWDVLDVIFIHVWRINHTVAYSLDGACTNYVESFFARLRNNIEGQHLDVDPDYAEIYAKFAAWLEDNRHLDTAARWEGMLELVFAHPVSANWRGRWQSVKGKSSST